MERLEKLAERIASWIGSAVSIAVHTAIFAGAFATCLLGVPFSTVLLVLTTIVSLEAIYLSIFVQMTVNGHSGSIRDIHRKIGGK